MYNKTVEDCFFLPRHIGALNSSESRTVFFSTEQFNQGSLIELYLHCDEDSIVRTMCFKTNGNPYLIASLECLCRQAIGQKLETLQVNHQELINLLEIPFNQVPLVMQVEQVYKEVVRLMNKKLKGES